MNGFFSDLLSIDLVRPRFLILRDDFITGAGSTDANIGELRWRNLALGTGTFVQAGIQSPAVPNSGQVNLVTNSTVPVSGNIVGIRQGLNTANFGAGWNTNVFEMNWVVSLPTSTTVSLYFGLINDESVFPDGSTNNKFIAIRYDTLLGDTQFKLTTENAAASVQAFTGVIDANWHNFRIWGDGSGTIFASMDGATPISLATNVPTQQLIPQVMLATRTAATRNLLIDFFGLLLRTAR